MSDNIEIPPKLEEILEADFTLSGFVKSSVSEFAPWLKQNDVKFFIEYTDHSLKHVSKVLETADKLIREKCRGIISAGDVATLILATLLHDCAMHLSEDGFATLIRSDNLIPGFNDKPWLLLWEDFIAESRRFSGRRLMALFGDTKPLHPPPSYPNDLDSHEMTGRDLLLIGEFLRRHHHRLAHEIALYGVPGPGGNGLKLPEKEEIKHIADLAGVVARSHGLTIRSCHDYLRGKYSSFKSFKRIHPVFLMALLRIADILQIQSDRAPRQVNKIRSLKSPVSRGEWEMHQAIKDINWAEYPETIFIHAEPPNARTYLKIKGLLAQIQHELDSSWTVMSEAYYAEESLRELGLKIRRVRSNLDDEKAFAKKVEYIPCHAAFEVADSDLLKLLIGPLYGESPEVGIRELMQNSIDSVLELREYLKKHPELKDVELTEQEGEVVVSIDEKEDGWWVTVSDQGIGMTLDTVRNYFLKAGASLRRSEIWRKTFENEENKSQVLRSGRFGIGVLAAYLLGGEVHVSTRHVGESADNGIMFSGELDAEMIELQKIRRPIGTTVRVRISDKVKEELLGEWDGKIEEWSNQDKWDWYCLTNPEVIRTVNGSNALQQTFQLPPINSELPVGWHRIRHPDYQDIHWTYLEAPKLTCNGIIIVDSSVFESVIFRKEDFGIKDPRISIFDYDANLPLNVQRTALTQKEYPFRKVLLLDALKDYIAFLIVNAPSKPVLNKSNLEWISKDDYPGKGRRKNYFYYDPFDTEDVYLFPWFFTKFGISFVDDPWHVNGIKTNSALLLQFYSQEYKFIPNIVPYSFQAVFVSSIERSHSYSKVGQAEALDVAISFALGKLCYYEDGDYYGILKYFLTRGKRMLVSCHVLRQIQKVAKFEQKDILSQELNSQLKKEWRNENWILLRLGDCPSPEFDFEKFATENDGKNYDEWPCILAEWYFKDKKPKFKMSQLAKVWRDLIGSPVIPYDLEERRQMKAYKELKPYIEAHEKLKSK